VCKVRKDLASSVCLKCQTSKKGCSLRDQLKAMKQAREEERVGLTLSGQGHQAEYTNAHGYWGLQPEYKNVLRDAVHQPEHGNALSYAVHRPEHGNTPGYWGAREASVEQRLVDLYGRVGAIERYLGMGGQSSGHANVVEHRTVGESRGGESRTEEVDIHGWALNASGQHIATAAVFGGATNGGGFTGYRTQAVGMEENSGEDPYGGGSGEQSVGQDVGSGNDLHNIPEAGGSGQHSVGQDVGSGNDPHNVAGAGGFDQSWVEAGVWRGGSCYEGPDAAVWNLAGFY